MPKASVFESSFERAIDAELFEAVSCAASASFIRELIERGADPGAQGGSWNGVPIDAFGWAVKTNDLGAVGAMADRAPLNRIIPDVGTPLAWAARLGEPELVEIFLRLGADPLLPSLGGFTPLMAACAQASEGSSAERCVEILVPVSDALALCGQPVAGCGRADALTLLAWLPGAGSSRAAAALLPASNLGFRSPDQGMGAFMAACWRGRKAIAELLLPHADLHAKDRCGRDALDQASGEARPWLLAQLEARALEQASAPMPRAKAPRGL